MGLVTFGTMVHVHELGFQELAKSYAFRGTKGYSAVQVAHQLGMAVRNDPRQAAASTSQKRFLLTVNECEFTLNSILDDLQRDRWPVTDTMTKRPARCTGSALSVAIGLLENLYSQNAGRIMLLTSGPCTVGPGQIVSQEKAESMRSYLDFQKENPNAQYTKKAIPYYTNLASRAISAGHTLDIFACSLDQVGLYEMRVLCDRTGGAMVMSDSFSYNVFKDSFKMLFSKVDADGGYLQMGFNAKIKTVCSKEFKVCGAVGGCCTLGTKHASVSETEIGESGTTEWCAGVLDRGTTLAFFFEPSNQGNNNSQTAGMNAGPGANRNAYLQFQTVYHHPAGKKRMRVTTLARAFAEPDLSNIGGGFDQEAAAVLMTRFAMFQMETTDSLDVLRRLDRVLIRLVSRFASFNKDDPMSFRLSQEFTLFPQFMFNLRRSNFLNTFNCSPDETAFYRTCLLRENVMNSLVMISPALMEYSFDSMQQPVPVLLDAESLKPNVILLLDCFFHVLIWRGETIQQWHDLGYHEKPEYENFKSLLQAPAQDALAILNDRFPVPKYIQTYAHGSASRFLLSKVNPSKTHANKGADGSAGGQFGGQAGQPQQSNIVLTDDVSYRVFLECLIKYAVQS